MPKLKLTKLSASSIKAEIKRVDYFDTEVKGLALRVTPNGIKTYSLVYRNALRQQKRYTIGRHGSITLIEVKREAQRLNLLISQGVDIQLEKNLSLQQENIESLTFKQYLDTFYLEWIAKSHKSADKTKNYLLTALCPLHNIMLKGITTEKLNKFLYQYKKDNNVSNSTLNKAITILKSALNRAVEFGYMDKNNINSFKKLKESSAKVRYLSKDETALFLSTLEKNQGNTHDIIVLAYYSGMRRGEIFSLKWKDIDFNTNQINLDHLNTKSGKSRTIPMHPKILDLLSTIPQSGKDEYIFKSPVTGGRLQDIKKSWSSFLKDAGISDFRFHDLRHNFASQLIMKGQSLSVVRELLGHSDFKMTLRYAHLAPEHKQEAINSL
mgnify:CR=1 FL=1